MPPEDAKPPGQGTSDQPEGDALFQKEQELLARARLIARRITARVKEVLKDTDTHEALTEETPLP